MEPAAWLYVDAVLKARDALLNAGISVLAYDLYPNGVGSVLIPGDCHAQALAVIAQSGIRVAQTPQRLAELAAAAASMRRRA